MRGDSARTRDASFKNASFADQTRRYFVEQVTGIEPALPAWEADALPLSYTCICLVYHRKAAFYT